MPTVGSPSLDHLRVFLTVAEEGSFGGAARKLNRAVSVISYAVANLEDQLGLVLFDRQGSRRPVLTDAGRAILADARAVSDDIDALKARVAGLIGGLEAEVSLALDVMIPAARVATILRDFQAAFPTVALRLHVEALGAIAALVLDRQALLGIAGPIIAEHDELERESAGSLTLVPVAAPTHPLASQTLSPAAARKHLQLVLTDRSPLTRGRDFSVVSPRTWRLADLGAKHALLREGIGWGNMPVAMIERDLADGSLVRLNRPDLSTEAYRLWALWRRDTPPGPATRWLLDALSLACADPGAGNPVA